VKGIPLIMENKNVLLIAPTGTGKTEAAFLPILDFLIKNPRSTGIKALYITPLRALNRDLLERMEWWCKRFDIKLGVRHGDTPPSERNAQAAVPPDILITTPETLQAILPGRIMKRHLSAIKWVIVDEVHELASDKRGSQLSLALERLRYLTGREFQLIGLSATIGTPNKVAKFLVGTKRKCEIVSVPVARSMEIEVIYPTPKKMDHQLAEKLYTFPEVAARLRVMKELIDKYKSVLIFTNTRSITEVLASRFKIWDINFPIGIHHGSLSKPSRISVERGLKEGNLEGIVCTSSLELGIDVGRLDLVIQYNSPRQVTRLLQRIGRSGHRIGRVAKGVVIVQDSDDALEALVIARRSLLEKLEEVTVPEKPYDALIHQLVGMMLEKRRWQFDEALELIGEAYPYRNLSEKDLVKSLSYMHNRYPRLCWFSLDDKVFLRPRWIKGFYRYYFENLSMIPDERHFLVIEEESEKPIGILDEAFVAEYGDPGTKFVEGGSLWKVLYAYGNRIYVKEEKDPVGAIPSWVGEEIPVPYEISQEVGEIRRIVEKWIKEGVAVEEIPIKLIKMRNYPCDESTMARALSEIFEQVESGSLVPTNERVTIERFEEYIIIHCSFGLMVNRTISRILGDVLSEKVGISVGVQQDPYRIIIKSDVELDALREMILNMAKNRDNIEEMAKSALVKTRMFKRRFIHVSRKVGAISKSASISDIGLDRLMKSFEGTAVFDEAVRDSLEKDMDVDRLSKILKKIDSGEIDISIIKGLSPIGRIGMEELSRKCDLIPPKRMEKVIIKYAKVRLMEEALTFVCSNCWKYVKVMRIKDIKMKEIRCPECGSSTIGALKESEETVNRAVNTKNKKGKLFDEITASANLISKYGKPATIAIAGRGITLNKASEILKEESDINDHLVKLIIEREKEALKRRFTPRKKKL
jgi:ATP-dependent Lhr-like helicase